MSPENQLLEPADTFYNTDSIKKPIADDATVKPENPDQPQDVKTKDKPLEDKVEDKSDVKPDDKPESKSDNEESETAQYLELDGKDVDLNDVRKWREVHELQKDYKAKTTEHGRFAKKERDQFALAKDSLTKEKSKVAELTDLLTALTAEDSDINWSELKEDDPEQYIELKEKADKRKQAIEKIRADKSVPDDDPALIAQEQSNLFASNPEWLDKNNKTTDVYDKEIKLINEYAASAGYSNDEYSKMTKSHQLITLLKAAKYDKLQEDGRKIKKEREEVPIVTKPKAAQAKQDETVESNLFYG